MAAACTWIDRDDVFEDYVRGTLSPGVRDEFEAHILACDACFDHARTYRALAEELKNNPGASRAAAQTGSRTALKWGWVGLAAAALVVAAAAAWWPSRAPVPPDNTIATGPSALPELTAPPPAPAIPSSPAPIPPAAPPAPPAALSAEALEALAQVEAPIYLPVVLRNLRDEAAERFQAGMQRYVAKDYAGAVPDLVEAARLKPNAPHAVFFLAICRLLGGDASAAAEGLQKTIALGDTPYLEEAHFYLAKVRLRQGDVSGARAELTRTIERHGPLEAEARRLLALLK
jgi:hypothetical protein